MWQAAGQGVGLCAKRPLRSRSNPVLRSALHGQEPSRKQWRRPSCLRAPSVGQAPHAGRKTVHRFFKTVTRTETEPRRPTRSRSRWDGPRPRSTISRASDADSQDTHQPGPRSVLRINLVNLADTRSTRFCACWIVSTGASSSIYPISKGQQQLPNPRRAHRGPRSSAGIGRTCAGIWHGRAPQAQRAQP